MVPGGSGRFRLGSGWVPGGFRVVPGGSGRFRQVPGGFRVLPTPICVWRAKLSLIVLGRFNLILLYT